MARANALDSDISQCTGISAASQTLGNVSKMNINSGIGAGDLRFVRGDMTWQPMPTVGTANLPWGAASTNNIVYYPLAGTNQTIGTLNMLKGVPVVNASSDVSLASFGASDYLLVGSNTGAPAPAPLQLGGHITRSSNALSAKSCYKSNVVTSSASAIQMSFNNSYIVNTTALTTFILPVTAPVGSGIWIVGISTGNWVITQNAGQSIRISSSLISTVGAGGSVASASAKDSLRLVCMTENTEWVAVMAPLSSGLTVV